MSRMTALCILVGLVAGGGAVCFFIMLEAGISFCMGYLANYHPATPLNEPPLFHFGNPNLPMVRWVLLILPAVGGLLSGIIVFAFAPEAEGHGTDAAIEAYHFKDGAVRSRVPLVKAIASMITIGSGGSAGREGPIAQIGSGFGSMLGRWLKIPPAERRTLMAAGMAGGIGAIFHAPLAGALFSTEVLYRDADFEHEILVPSFISSIVAYSVFGAVFGFHALFETPDYAYDRPETLLPYLILALVSSLGAIAYIKAFYGFRSLMFNRLKRIPNFVKPAIGGFLTGVVGFCIPEALGSGYGVLQACFHEGNVGIAEAVATLPSAAGLGSLLPASYGPIAVAAILLALVGVAKIATTAFSVGSGGAGGVFGPAVVIGGALGGATGLVCAKYLTAFSVQPGTFALVGMAGFFAGAANSPVSTIIMVSELTGNYNLLVPSMLVCIVSFVLCRRFQLYEKQLPSRLDAPTKMGNMASAILRHITVDAAVVRRKDTGLVVVHEDMSLAELIEQFADSTQSCFPVVDDNEELLGVVDAGDIRRTITEVGVGDLIIAGDIEMPARTVALHDSLLSAINNMVKSGSSEIIVVDDHDDHRIVGTLSRGDVIAAYNRQIVAGAD
jgi:CIC family chloride channel protein